MNSRIRHQVGLELSYIYVESSIKPERGCERRNHLRDKSVQICVGRPLDVQISSANVIDSLVVEHNCHISVFQKGVGGKD